MRQGPIAIPRRRKSILVFLAKLLIVAVPIFYLIDGGRFDLARQIAVLYEPASVVLLFLLWAASFVVLVALRWGIVARILDLDLPAGFAIKAHLAGVFLSSWLPGGIGGDLWKAYRFGARLKASGNRPAAYLSVVLDRVVGLYALMLCGSFCVLLEIGLWLGSAYAVLAILLLASCVLATALGLLLLFAPRPLPPRAKGLIERVTARYELARMLVAQIRSIRNHKTLLLRCLSMSILIQVLNVLFFGYIAMLVTGQPVSFITISAIFTISLLVTIASMAPGGLGVGHLMFDVLFADFGLRNGADVFNVFYFVTTFFSLAGLLPYLLPETKEGRALK